MQSIGIDLGAAQSDVAMIATQGSKIVRHKLKTKELGAWLRRQEPSRVVMESCTQSRAVAQLAMQAHHEAIVIPAHIVRNFGVAQRGIRTDKKDAEALAHAGLRNQDLSSVYIRPAKEEERKARGAGFAVGMTKKCTHLIRATDEQLAMSGGESDLRR
jgi:transposase